MSQPARPLRPVDLAKTPRLSAEQWRFLLLEQGIGAAVFNFLVNGGLAWLIVRGATKVVMWGPESIAGDTIGTAFVLPLLTAE